MAMNCKQRHKCPYAYHDGMQRHGVLSPFILNPDITLMLFFYLHAPATWHAARKASEAVNMKPILHTLDKG